MMEEFERKRYQKKRYLMGKKKFYSFFQNLFFSMNCWPLSFWKFLSFKHLEKIKLISDFVWIMFENEPQE